MVFKRVKPDHTFDHHLFFVVGNTIPPIQKIEKIDKVTKLVFLDIKYLV